eukprot:11449332-Prorocentrum_lima.AAC.1
MRKLHHRWWHASQKRMHSILAAAGAPPSALKIIPQIVDIARYVDSSSCHHRAVWPPHVLPQHSIK